MAQYAKIYASEYNSIQTKIATVLGRTSDSAAEFGYGQDVLSSQVGNTSKVTKAQWDNLRTDILKARQHQTGNDESGALTVVTTTRQISETIRSDYLSLATTAETNKLAVPPTSQSETNNLTSKTRDGDAIPWSGTVSHSLTVSWGTRDEARYYFNAGGEIRFVASLGNGPIDDAKYLDWASMLQQMATIKFNWQKTTSTDTSNATNPNSTNYNVGFYNLPTLPTTEIIYRKKSGATAYVNNEYYIRAGFTDSTRKAIQFTIYFLDGAALPTPVGQNNDEVVKGLLTSTVKYFRAAGVNVDTPSPAVTSGNIV